MPDIDPLAIASVASQAAGGVISIGESLFDGAKANKIERQAGPRPEYKIQSNIKDNQDIAENRASQGLSDGAVTAYEQENEHSLSASLDAISKNGGNANHIAQVYGAANAGASRFALMDEQMRAANVGALIQQNERMSEEKDKAWELNEFDPWKDQMAKAAEFRNRQQQNFSNGVNSIMGAGANMATANMYNKEKGDVFPQTRRSAAYPVDADVARVSQPRQLPAVAGDRNVIASKWPGLTIGYGTIGPANYGG